MSFFSDSSSFWGGVNFPVWVRFPPVLMSIPPLSSMVRGVGIEVYFEGSGIGYGQQGSGGYGDVFWGGFEGSDGTVLGYYPIAGLGNGTGGYSYWGVFLFRGLRV